MYITVYKHLKGNILHTSKIISLILNFVLDCLDLSTDVQQKKVLAVATVPSSGHIQYLNSGSNIDYQL